MLKEDNKYPSPILIKDLGTHRPTANSNYKKRYGLYKCHCGKEFRAATYCVNNGNTNSCGCYNKKRILETHTSHGMTKTRLYVTWQNIIKRVAYPKAKAYKDYGGRGIKICDEWRNDFMAFYSWAIKNGYDDSLTIDRIDNDGHYEPSNCRWTTRTVQSRNTQKLRSDNTSGYRGVIFRKSGNVWHARIGIGGQMQHIGFYKTAIEAAKAYDRYVIDNRLEHTINGVV